MYFRFPQVEKQIVPVIIPPTIKKEFPHKEFDRIWTDTWKALRRASAIHVLGFSLPPEDLHVRFVIRSAIRGNEASRTRSLPVTIVNPDRNVFLRFARLVESPVTYFECGLEEVALDELLGSSRKPVRATLVEPLPKSD